MRSGSVVLFLILFITSIPVAHATTGEVVTVYNGDTFVADVQGEEIKIKLYGIDAPGTGQPGSHASTRFLKRLIFKAQLKINVIGTDAFGRTLAVVINEGRESSVNAALVSHGYAWVNPRTCQIDDCSHWKELESRAKSLKLGIWSGFDLVPPWEFRTMNSR
jgi:micrococcal nuclease